MNVVRRITRYVPRWGIFYAPYAQETDIRLVEAMGNYFVCTLWAMLNSSADATDEQLAASCRPCFETAGEALKYAHRMAPHWYKPHNQTVLGHVHDARHWRNELVGVGQLADAMLMSRDQVYAIARGAVEATEADAIRALSYKGGTV